MAIDPAQWSEIRRLFRRAFDTSLHFSLATVDEDGTPRVSPIGSLVLRGDGTGYYFELYAKRLGNNLDRGGGRVCVMAVDSGKLFWLGALWRGRFSRLPAVRLHGTASPLRDATPEEVQNWLRRVRRARWLKGHDLLWKPKGPLKVRDIAFDSFEPVRLGKMGGWRLG